MPVPDTQSFLLPVLKALSDGKELSLANLQEQAAESLRLTPDDIGEMLPSGRYSMLYHRVYTAAMYLWRADLVQYPRRGFRQLTEDGKQLVKNLPAHLDLKYIHNLPSYKQWQDNSQGKRKVAGRG